MKITNIVFTKNRPLQLHAYLESLYRFLPAELIQTRIIYKVESFQQQYEQVFRSFPACIVLKEKDFHSDLLDVISRVDTPYILFGIDDVVYFDTIDFDLIDKTFREHGEDIFGFSLRFGPDTFKDTDDVVEDVSINGQTVHGLNWQNGTTSFSRYPFELCATVYRTELVKKIVFSAMNNNVLIKKVFSPSSLLIRTISKVVSTRSILKSFGYFFSPNTFESWNCRWCQRHSTELPPMLCFQKQCAAAVQVNIVSISARKKINGPGEYTVESLANKYIQSYRFDINYIAQNKPSVTHLGPEYFILTRNKESKV